MVKRGGGEGGGGEEGGEAMDTGMHTGATRQKTEDNKAPMVTDFCSVESLKR